MIQHRARTRRFVLLCSLLLLSGVAVGLIGEALAVPTATTVERWVIAAGGGHAEAAPYAMDSTIGQAVVGMASAAPYGICSGFRCGMRAPLEARVFLPLVLRNH